MRVFLCLSLALFAGTIGDAAAEPGVFSDRIVFGQAAAFSGPAAGLGTGMRDGLKAAFAEVNAKGGVKGRKLELVTRDDGYDPQRSIAATRELVETENVFALIGPVGTPTTIAAQGVARAAAVPVLGPFTGADALRAVGQMPNVVNLRASYGQETETMVERLTGDLGVTRIAVFYQDDAFGRAGLNGARAALERRGMTPVAVGPYERNTIAVKSTLLRLRRAKAEAVIMVGAYKPSAVFIKLAREIGFDPVFVNISFVGSEALAGELGAQGSGVLIAQVVPFPLGDDPVAVRFRAALGTVQGATPGFINFEGYLVGRLAIAALQRIDGEPTRGALLTALRSTTPIDIDGLSLSFGAGDNQGLDLVSLTEIVADGTFQPRARLTRAHGPS